MEITGFTPAALESELALRLRTRALGRRVEVHEVLGSTQDRARALASAGAPEGTLVWALEQVAGRGRMDRTWISARGAGLWYSLVLRPQVGPEDAAVLALVAGVGVARGLAAQGIDATLKWPNDVHVDGRKVGGLLAEAETSGGALRHVILGVGVNLRAPAGGFPAEVAQTAGALFTVGVERTSPAAVLASLLAGTEAALDEYAEGGPDWLRHSWIGCANTIGRRVRVDLAGGSLEGQAIDLRGSGALVVRDDAGVDHAVLAGEVRHLR